MKRPWSPDRNEPHWIKFQQQRGNAKKRGITWNLTYSEWWSIWEHSGYWNKRGRGSSEYCMARHGDKGAYEIGNVGIITNHQNRADRSRNYPPSEEHKMKIALANTKRSGKKWLGNQHTGPLSKN
jgi:hypothetical protein